VPRHPDPDLEQRILGAASRLLQEPRLSDSRLAGEEEKRDFQAREVPLEKSQLGVAPDQRSEGRRVPSSRTDARPMRSRQHSTTCYLERRAPGRGECPGIGAQLVDQAVLVVVGAVEALGRGPELLVDPARGGVRRAEDPGALGELCGVRAAPAPPDGLRSSRPRLGPAGES